MYGNVWEWCQDWYGDYPKVFWKCGPLFSTYGKPSADKFDLLANAEYAIDDPGFVDAAKSDFRLRPDAPLLAPLAALHAADAPFTVRPWTLADRNGSQCLLTSGGEPFLMLGISHVGGAFGQNPGEDRGTLKGKIERELRGWGFNTVPASEFWDRFPFIVPLDRLVRKTVFHDQEPFFEPRDVSDLASAAAIIDTFLTRHPDRGRVFIYNSWPGIDGVGDFMKRVREESE